MGIFSRNKSKPDAEPTKVWNQLSSIKQLNELVLSAQDKPVVIFKHSTRCGISSMAWNSFRNNWTSEDTLADVYVLDLLNHRDVSNEVAEVTGVYHQSPQAIVLKGTEVIYEATHSGIDARQIESILRKG
ncbi:MAG: bacillithiol system protein YtxJ [Salibacteraceae bacterium]|jgi:bacillithiol system protein YtxJ